MMNRFVMMSPSVGGLAERKKMMLILFGIFSKPFLMFDLKNQLKVSGA